jgi:hypothetical protein
MKNLKTFNEFINENENFVNEGALASKFSKSDFGSLEDNADTEDPDMKEFYDDICKELGVKDASQVYGVDSETNEDDPLTMKIYNYLNANLNTKEIGKHSEPHGVLLGIDPDKNVIRYDEYGFVAFYFTKDSKF